MIKVIILKLTLGYTINCLQLSFDIVLENK